MPASHLALLLGVQVIWGGNFVVMKIGLTEMPPLMLMTLRFLTISLLIFPFLRWHRGQMGLLLAIAICGGGGHFALMIMGLARAEDVGPIAIAVQLGVPFATILSVLFLGERLGTWRTMALVIAFGGVVVISFDPKVVRYLEALGMVTLSALMMAIATVLMRRIRGVGVYDMQAWIAVASWPVLLVLSLWLEDDPVAAAMAAGWAGWSAVAYTVFGVSLVGHAALYWSLQRHEVTVVAPILLLAPVIGTIGGVIFLGDTITWRVVLGGLMTLVGVLVITLRESAKGRPAPRPEPPT